MSSARYVRRGLADAVWHAEVKARAEVLFRFKAMGYLLS